MNSRPAISVITPSFNRCDSLKRAIRSVGSQTFPDYEQIVVDDGSTDETSALLNQIGSPRLSSIRFQTNQGANSARNAGIAAATAPVITFLDSDDEFLADRLAKTVDFFHKNPNQDLLIHSFRTIRDGRVYSGVNPGATVGPFLWKQLLIANAVFIAGSAISIRASLLNRIGGFDPELGRMQDREFLLRSADVSDAVLDSEVDWVKHTSSDSLSSGKKGYLAALASIYRKHPTIRSQNSQLAAYLVCRMLLAELQHLELKRAVNGYLENRILPELGFSTRALITGYFSGKRKRRLLKNQLRDASET